jgi:hypothetical protein
VSNGALSHDSVYRLAIEIENSQISKVTRFNDKRERIGDPIGIYKQNRYAFLYKSGMRKMPDLPEGYPENQKKFANILINTIWLNPDNYSLRWKVEDALSNKTFSDLLDVLADLAFKGRGKQMKFGGEVFKDRINVYDKEGLLELCSFAENIDQPTAAVFDLDKIRAHAMEIGVPLIWGKEQIMMNLDSLERLLATGAERVAIMRILDNTKDIGNINIPKELQQGTEKNSRGCYLHNNVLLVCQNKVRKPKGYAGTFNIQDVLNQWPLSSNIQRIVFHQGGAELVLKDPANKAVSMVPPPLKNKSMEKHLPEENLEWQNVE